MNEPELRAYVARHGDELPVRDQNSEGEWGYISISLLPAERREHHIQRWLEAKIVPMRQMTFEEGGR